MSPEESERARRAREAFARLCATAKEMLGPRYVRTFFATPSLTSCTVLDAEGKPAGSVSVAWMDGRLKCRLELTLG